MKAKSKTLSSKYYEKDIEVPSFIFYGLLILLFYPPFFRGLFFAKELMPTHIFTAITFFVYFLATRKSEINHKYSWVEIGFFMLIGSYIIATLMGVNLNLSIQETLKYINYLLILLLAKRVINNREKLRTALTTLVFAGVIVVFIGTGTALETFTYNGAFTGGMMCSTLQYHNTFGVYCLAILFLAYMLFSESIGKMKYVMGIATFMLFFGLIISYSRGAWVLVPVVGLIYYLLIPTDYKISFMSAMLGNLIGVLAIIKPFTEILGMPQILELPDKQIGWLWVILGIAISLVVTLLIEKLLYKMNLKEKIYNLFIPIVAIVIPAVGLLLKNQLLVFLPGNLAQRLGSISLGTETVTERAVFYKDAFKIIKDHPIFGTGGGGWSTIYKMYQTYAYNSTQAHNYFMQLWIEIGTVGLIIFAGILIAYLYHSFKTYKSCDDASSKGLLVAMFTTVMTILLHSAIDFDLTYGSMSIIMWSIIGMQLSMDNDIKEISTKIGSKVKYVAVGLTVILLILGTTNNMAMNATYKGIALIQNNDIQMGTEQFKKASKLNPFDPASLGDYANITNSIALQTKNKEELEDSIKVMDKAVALGKYDFKILSNAAKFYFKNAEVEKGLETIKTLEKYQPLNAGTYEIKSFALVTVADAYISNQEKEKAIPLLKDVVEIENKVNKLNEEINSKVEMNNLVRLVEITPKTRENIEKAKEKLNTLNLE